MSLKRLKWAGIEIIFVGGIGGGGVIELFLVSLNMLPCPACFTKVCDAPSPILSSTYQELWVCYLGPHTPNPAVKVHSSPTSVYSHFRATEAHTPIQNPQRPGGDMVYCSVVG